MGSLFDTKALLWSVELLAKPIQEEDLEARAQVADRQVEAMNEAEKALGVINELVTVLAGTEKFAAACDIAYAPHELDGLKLVGEYYRRASLIERL